MKKMILISMLGIMLLLPLHLHADGSGTTGAQFLKIDSAARPMGMGGAYAAVKPDASSIFYNPALTASAPQRTVSGTYLSYFQSVNYGSLAGVMPSGSGSLGMGVSYLGVKDIPGRGMDDVDDPDGTSEPEREFGASDAMVTAAKAWHNAAPSILEDIDLGISMKLIYLTVDDENAVSALVDLGAYYPLSDMLSFGLSIQNLGVPVKFDKEADPLPIAMRGGASYTPVEGLSAALDLNHYILDNIIYASLGAEYWLVDSFALRAGYKYGYETDVLGAQSGLGAGIGFRMSGMVFDYAYAPMGELGNTHRVTLTSGF